MAPWYYLHPTPVAPIEEKRARASGFKSNVNFSDNLPGLLYGYGAPEHPDRTHPHPDSQHYLSHPPTQNKHHKPTPFDQPFPETVRVLDEILTDFIVETCHNAVAVASYAGRAKLKLDDFTWVMRKDKAMLGRVQEMLTKKRKLDEQKRKVDLGTGEAGKLDASALIDLGEMVGEEGTGKGKGRGRGRRKKKVETVGGEAHKVGSKAEVGKNVDDEENEDEDEVDERPSSKRARSDAG